MRRNHRRGHRATEPGASAAYRQRSRIEQVVGWYKECRALGTRHDKLAVNYLALWMVASIEKLLRKYWKRLEPGLSERA